MRFDLARGGIRVALAVAASIVLSACGEDAPRSETSVTADATQTTDSASLCTSLAEDPRFGGQAHFVGALAADGSIECGLEFRADAAAVADLGLAVDPLCPPEASIIVKFTQAESGELIFDEMRTAETDNGSCLQ